MQEELGSLLASHKSPQPCVTGTQSTHWLVSPDFLSPATCDPLKRFNMCVAWENRMSQGIENRGSLISAPLALRERDFIAVWDRCDCHRNPKYQPFFPGARSRSYSKCKTVEAYIYIYAVESIFWSSLGVSKVNILAKFVFFKNNHCWKAL